MGTKYRDVTVFGKATLIVELFTGNEPRTAPSALNLSSARLHPKPPATSSTQIDAMPHANRFIISVPKTQSQGSRFANVQGFIEHDLPRDVPKVRSENY
jgi:hypothetical protein